MIGNVKPTEILYHSIIELFIVIVIVSVAGFHHVSRYMLIQGHVSKTKQTKKVEV